VSSGFSTGASLYVSSNGGLHVEKSAALILHTRPANSCVKISDRAGESYHEDLVDDVADRFGETTRVGAVEANAEFTQAMLPGLQEAVEHPDMTEELADILSTRAVDIVYEVSISVNVRE